MWLSGADSKSWFELYQPLTSLLYRIGLVGFATRDHGAPLFFNDDPLLAESSSSLGKANNFHVHRMFHKALDVDPAADRQQQN
jgi:hypothetical protein